MATLEQELIEQIRRLDEDQQKRVLDFVRELGYPRGELVKDFLERTNNIYIPKEDLEEMLRYIEEDEERIDWDDWNNPPTLFA